MLQTQQNRIVVEKEELIIEDNKYVIQATIKPVKTPATPEMLNMQRAQLVAQKGNIETAISRIDQLLTSMAAKPLEPIKPVEEVKEA